MIDFSKESQIRAGVVQYRSIMGGDYIEFEIDSNGDIISNEGLRLLEPMDDLEYDSDVSIDDVLDMLDEGWD